ncbi:MAG: hypothetical protein EKK54_04420 [Neisseriaceae bacterium]|nr:MAG: hypothetical protein EKK54_04420 [Neisseriaceae bacterium]
MSKYLSRGSEWRKWDLHVHSPFSKGYTGTWSNFCEQVNNADCDVIGINDYFSVAGYRKLIEEIENGSFETTKIFFPIVEFRMTDVLTHKASRTNGGTNFNFHIIFNNTLNIEDIESFIRSLKSEGQIIGSDYSDKEKLATKKVSFDEVLKELETDRKFMNNFLVWIPYDEYGGIDNIDPNSDSFIKQDFIKRAHVLGSANEKQIKYFLWASCTEDGKPKFSNDDYRKAIGVKKACIKGSDSHHSSYPLGKLKDQDSKPTEKFCWIKAEMTFNGLKQVVYEPEERVKIQELEPEQKSPYLVIDKCKYVDSSFMVDELVFSSNLTVVIGGKSTGKSLLLRNIAEAIDSAQVSKKLKEVEIPPYKKQVSGFSVSWFDGKVNQKEISSRNNFEGEMFDNPEIGKKIIYIPQSYLNRLSDNNSNSAIADIIITLIKQNQEIQDIFDLFESNKQLINSKIYEDINKLFSCLGEFYELNNQIKEIGDESGITKELDNLRNEIEQLQQQAGISTEDRQLYLDKQKEKNQLEKEINDINDSITYLNQIKDITLVNDPNLSPLKIEFANKINQGYQNLKLTFHEKWQEIVSESIAECTNLSSENNKLLEACITIYNPLLEKMKKNNLLSEKIRKVNELSGYVQEISAKKVLLNKCIDNYWAIFGELLNKYASYFRLYEQFSADQSSKSNLTGSNLKFKFEVRFLANEFYNKFVDLVCDGRRISTFINIPEYRTSAPINDYTYKDIETLISDFEKVFKGIMNEKLSLKNNITKQEAITKLFENRFDIHYDIIQDNDCLSTMSQGKKSLVLLQLLIEMDNSKCPILLDQPEDDLDNRSIYNELVKFIKHKKKERQIIIATHNPNLVVGADAECVIVAHQTVNPTNNSYKFEYVSGALENTFVNSKSNDILYKQGIQEHVCEILEGGKEAFQNRKNKYHIS